MERPALADNDKTLYITADTEYYVACATKNQSMRMHAYGKCLIYRMSQM